MKNAPERMSAFRLLDPEAASQCSDVSGSTGDESGEVVLALERKSVQPFKTQDEYVYAMMEDLSEWLCTLYDVTINPDNFYDVIETGVLLCEHANAVQDFIHDNQINQSRRSNPRSTPLSFAEDGVRYKSSAKPGTFLARDNISNFLSWCVRIGIPDDLRFETEDLVSRKHERNVILCMLEVARRGAKYGMLAPQIIQLEQEIDREIAGEAPPTPPPEEIKPIGPQPQIKTCDLMSLDEMVRDMVSRCSCPVQFPMIKVSDGKYRIGDSKTLIFVRILRNHVMVRIGGGWDTLENYLNRHDPCRCANKGHRPARGGSPSPMKRRASAPQTGLQQMQLNTKTVQREACIPEVTSPTRRISLATSNPSRGGAKPHNHNPSTPHRPTTPSRPTTPHRPTTPSRQTSPHSSPKSKRRNLPNVPGENTPTTPRKSYERATSPSPYRPQSARSSRRNSENSLADSEGSQEDLLDGPKRQQVRPKSALESRRRMSNLKPTDMLGSSTKSSFSKYNGTCNTNEMGDNSIMVITRGDSGRHTVDRTGGNDTSDSEVVDKSMVGNGLTRTLSNMSTSSRFQISPDKLLPSKMKNFSRSGSTSDASNGLYQNGVKSRSFSNDLENDTTNQNGIRIPNSVSANHMSGTWSHDSNQSLNSAASDSRALNNSGYFGMSAEERRSRFGSNFSLDVEEYPEAPPEDEELNKQMEELFEEYRRIEKGTFTVEHAIEPNQNKTNEKKTVQIPRTKSGKPDMSKVKSRIREYLESKPVAGNPNRQSRSTTAQNVATPRRATTPTPRRSQTPTPRGNNTPGTPRTQTDVVRRSQTPQPQGYRSSTATPSGRTTPVQARTPRPTTPSGNRSTTVVQPRTSGGRTTPVQTEPKRPTTPVQVRRNLPQTPANNTNLSSSSQISFSGAWENPAPAAKPGANSQGTTPANKPQVGSTAWKRMSRSTTDLSRICDNKNTNGFTNTTPTARGSAFTNTAHSNGTNKDSTQKRPQSARTTNNQSIRTRTSSTTNVSNGVMRSGYGPRQGSMGNINRASSNSAQNTTSAFSTVNNKSKQTPASPIVRRRGTSVDRRQVPSTSKSSDNLLETSTRRSRVDGGVTHSNNSVVHSNSTNSAFQTRANNDYKQHNNNTSQQQQQQQQKALRSSSAIDFGSCGTTSRGRNGSNSSFSSNSSDHTSANNSSIMSDNITSQTLALQSQSVIDWCEAKLKVQIPEDISKPRKEKQPERPKTKIPLPANARRCQSADPFSQNGSLKRYDSGVDINNMSPTESSIHGDDDVTWSEAAVMSPQPISTTNNAFDEEEGEFF